MGRTKKQGIPSVVMTRVGDLTPYARNSRTHSDEQVAQIAASIKEFGWTNPILIDGEKGIIAGHGRLKAAMRLGLEEIPAIELSHLTEIQKKALIIADNKLALNAGWDTELLSLELEELELEGLDLSLTGFGEEEISALKPEVVNEGLTDEDAVPEPPPEPITKPGDIWILGKHRLMCGDSTSVDAVDRLMDGQKADAVITDPPYNVGKNYAGEDLDGSEFESLHTGWLSVASIYSKEDSPFYIYFGVKWLWKMSVIVNNYLMNSRLLIWYRPDGHGAGGGDFFYNYDPIFYGSKTGKFAVRKYEGDFNRDVWVVNKAKESEGGYQHPTAKPIKVVDGAILTSTNKNDIVLDLFGGSGTTIISAEMQGRCARLMELDPKYCDVIVKRWEEFTGQKARLENAAEIST
jgi:DNA modification methylase